MKNELEAHLLVISKIIMHANSSFDVVKYLEREDPNDAPILKYEKAMNKFFHFASVNFYRLTVIELCKLYNHSEDFSLQRPLGEFGNQKSFFGLMDLERIKPLQKLLKDNRSIIEKLIMLRNTQYAHQDKDQVNYLGLETIKIQKLLDDAKTVFNAIYGGVLNKDYFFDFPLGTPIDDLKFIVERLKFHDEHYQLMEENIKDFIK